MENTEEEAPSQVGSTEAKQVLHWLKEIDASSRHEKDWRERAEKIIKRYRDERDNANKNVSRYNILFANTEVLYGALYQKAPTPDVRRRFKDEDPVGRVTADVLSRSLSYCIDAYDFDSLMRSEVKDMLLPGRAVARVRYKPTFAKVDGPPDEQGQPTQVDQVVYEEAPSEYVEWDMFRMSPAKRWSKVRWVAFGELMTRDDLKKNFPEVAPLVKLTWCPDEHKDKSEDDSLIYRRALVWVIWNKTDRKVYAITDGYKDAPLAVEDDPLRLEDFFPCPKPLYSIFTNDSLIPIPEYTEYEDQALELDVLTQRITKLTDALRRRGVYDAKVEELKQLANATDNLFIPVSNYATLLEKGGLEKAFNELDNTALAAVVVQLLENRETVKQTIYEITGISDIARGSTDPNETKGAQQLKAQYTSIRIEPRQRGIENYARDLLRLKAEIMAEHFSPETLQQMTGVKLPTQQEKQVAIQQASQPTQGPQGPQPPDPKASQAAQALVTWDDVMNLLRNEKLRSFRVDIETDSTIRADDQADKEAVSEMMQALSSMLQELIPAVQAGAIPRELAMKLMLFVLRRFKVSKDVEEEVEKWADTPPPPQPPSPEQIKAQAEQQKMQHDQQMQQGDLQAKQMEMQSKQQDSQAEMASKAADAQLAQQTAALDMEKLQVEREKLDVARQKNMVDALSLTQQKKSMESGASSVGDKEGNAQIVALVQTMLEQFSRPKQATMSDGRTITVRTVQ